MDVDPRNSGDIERVRKLLADDLGVRVFAEVITPGGGRHFYVAGHPDLPSRQTIEGWPGVEIKSHKANITLPGTLRPKYGGAGYTIVFDDLQALDRIHAADPDPQGTAALCRWVAENSPKKDYFRGNGQSGVFEGDLSNIKPYAVKALNEECRILAAAPEGEREMQTNKSALKLGHLVGGGELPEEHVVDRLFAACEENEWVDDVGVDGVLFKIRHGLDDGKMEPKNVPQDQDNGDDTSQKEETAGDSGQQENPSEASWGRISLTKILSGDRKVLEPTLFARSDGVCMIYPGLVHSFHGESESGKSLIVQAECVRVLNRGEDVLYLDFESDEESVVARLVTLGADPAMVDLHFDYRRPETKPSASGEQAAWLEMLSNHYTLAVIDGVTDALGTCGLSLTDNDDTAQWIREVPRVIARRTGAGVVVIDHVVKDASSRGRWAIGGQAKMGGLTGASYTVEAVSPLGIGMRGEVQLRVGKDRPGSVRQHCGPFRKSDRTQLAAKVIVDSTDKKTTVTIGPPGAGRDDDSGQNEFRPTHLMQRVSELIENHPDEEYSKNKAAATVGGSKQSVLTGIDILVREGFLTTRRGRSGYPTYQSVKPYREAEDPLSDHHIGRNH